MSTDILRLEPHAVWRNFYSLTRVPRPSGHEEKIREFVSGFGRKLGLETIVDEVGNVIIRKPATSGMEKRKGVILQAHLDMVPEKNGDKLHDFARDPIDAFVDGDWVRARGTTLGADNGMGVAAAMAVLESTTLRHGFIEALFTCEEEAGMTGAIGLKPDLLKGEILLNMDSEDEGELFIGCAGGLDGTMTFSYSEERISADYTGFVIRVSGLKGGHSGMDIHLGRGNANKIMNRILYEGHARYGMRLASIDGGTLRNAIPREATATVAVPTANTGTFYEGLSILAGKIKHELSTADPELCIEVVPAGTPEMVIEAGVVVRLLNALYACPDGVMRMSSDMAGLVETSSNLAMVTSVHGVVTIKCLLRSSVDSAMEDLKAMIGSLFDLAGAGAVFDGGYPGWKPNPDSPILKRMQEVYTSKFGKTPEIKAVHAGLECGIIGGTSPSLDMISFGPTIRYPHSPDEKVNIASVGKFWDFLVETLRMAP
ncbi:aminoacyl-histidine dipeptidase [Chlorobium phaeobacteroides]|jgi:dipeptidase D|uniref:Cytosol non-specific dipeptidase n=1 Tax=Chlorobium phaeobacteroides (strain DSM 266 / SMG 266 / 2430) TaxID=290317 RepID=A1BH24_CHLPD|nr:aminoacyl-histidine dipeptidase [Chlorobium phaeobacteroides]ABL65701.1 Pep581 peptidase, Metallo peptidase, MEROPS family M20C [Chlorobium phaeobacteroides DSM 266]MBV5330217.1 aminoacyl-histidine dipeptidase [Chlorobium sp.]